MKRSQYLSVGAIITVLIIAAVVFQPNRTAPPIMTQPEIVSPSPAASPTPPAEREVVPPLDRAVERITKKPFGIRVSPQDSPVSPERFSGFHTAVDFETFPEEQETDVPVAAICAGEVLVKRTIAGYGGVLVQSCTLDGEAITVLYGHLRFNSIRQNVGDLLAQGEMIGVLGQGYSPETDGERKHLHLGIHRGTGVNLRGYVATAEELVAWIDVKSFLQ